MAVVKARPAASEAPRHDGGVPRHSLFSLCVNMPRVRQGVCHRKEDNRTTTMKDSIRVTYAAGVLLLSLMLAGCGSGQNGESAQAESRGDVSGLGAEELSKGIGPVRSVNFGPVDAGLAEKGEAIFTTKCSACHKMDQRYVGPPLGEVLTRRSPEFVMNMMLNPAEMVEKHPEVKALLAQYFTPMPSQNLTEEDARAVLEYLRHEQQGQEEQEEQEEQESGADASEGS